MSSLPVFGDTTNVQFAQRKGINPGRGQSALWEGMRLTLTDALDLTAQSLRAYAADYRHWALAYSGGKDSTATLAAVLHLISIGQVPAPASLTVLYSDTR